MAGIDWFEIFVVDIDTQVYKNLYKVLFPQSTILRPHRPSHQVKFTHSSINQSIVIVTDSSCSLIDSSEATSTPASFRYCFNSSYKRLFSSSSSSMHFRCFAIFCCNSAICKGTKKETETKFHHHSSKEVTYISCMPFS